MAGVYVTDGNVRILVKNIPPKLTCDKLEIYFQKKTHGGCGDVTSITFPKSRTEPDQAVIEFSSSSTVRSVLGYGHQILGHQLEITEFPEQRYGGCDVVINKATIEKLNTSPDPDLLSSMQDSTGVKIETIKGVCHLKGQWYQIVTAMDRIEQILEGNVPSAKAGSSSTIPVKPSTDDNEAKLIKKAVFLVEDHVYQYYKICYADIIKSLEKKFKVTIQYDAGKLSFSPLQNSDSNAEEALRRFKPQYESFTTKINVKRFDYSGFTFVTEEEINEAIAITNESKKVHVGYGVRQNRRREILFVAMNTGDLDNAIQTFRNLCMPAKNTVLAKSAVKNTKAKVSIIHGDYRKESCDVILSEVDKKGNGRILSSCDSQTVTDVKAKCSQASANFFLTSSGRKGTECSCLLHYVINKDDVTLKTMQKTLVDAFSFITFKAKRVVLPIFKLYGSEIKSIEQMEAVLSAIRINSLLLEGTEVCIVHNNQTEAIQFVQVMKSSRKFRLIVDDIANQGPNRKNSSTNDEDQKEPCPICLDELDALGAVALRTLPCKHAFHQACIDKAFKVSMKCPMCMKFYGKVEGNQPKSGRMRHSILKKSLPGYEGSDTIVIEYYFPDGVQGTEHPSPGMRYTGTGRTAYLPNSQEGRELLLLLQKAFESRLTFTIGRSVTTGRNNVVTWNDIHHKTSMHGGPSGYGYPDPSYMRRLKMELADKGVTLNS